MTVRESSQTTEMGTDHLLMMFPRADGKSTALLTPVQLKIHDLNSLYLKVLY